MEMAAGGSLPQTLWGWGLSFPALKGLGVEPFCFSAVMERQSNLSGALVRFTEGKTVVS
jgi:hypothetical protein